MYFKIIRAVLDRWIPRLAATQSVRQKKIHDQIRAEMEKTSSEHRHPDPEINYDLPVCRLGYLYMHAAANATLFEWLLRDDDHLTNLLRDHDGKRLRVVSIGGGPGTELLGLYKTFSRYQWIPKKLDFWLLDLEKHWGDTWSHLAELAEAHLEDVLGDDEDDELEAPALSSQFHEVDVTRREDYKNYAYLFTKVDLVVCNYLVSENQERLEEFAEALGHIVAESPRGAMFVVIDRWERKESTFRTDVEEMFEDCGLSDVHVSEFGPPWVIEDEESDLGPYPKRFNRRPRRWFKPYGVRKATVFALVGKKA